MSFLHFKQVYLYSITLNLFCDPFSYRVGGQRCWPGVTGSGERGGVRLCSESGRWRGGGCLCARVFVLGCTCMSSLFVLRSPDGLRVMADDVMAWIINNDTCWGFIPRRKHTPLLHKRITWNLSPPQPPGGPRHRITAVFVSEHPPDQNETPLSVFN